MRFLNFRYFALYEYGGFYADLDVECLKPLDTKLAEHDCFVSVEPDIHALIHYEKDRLLSNGVMACRPRHPFFQYVADSLTRDNRVASTDVSRATGPRMLDGSYDEFKCVYPDYAPHIPDDDVFQPLPDPRAFDTFYKECKKIVIDKIRNVGNLERAVDLCRPFLNHVKMKPSNQSLTNHNWVHDWIIGSFLNKFGMRGYSEFFNAKDLY